jgi:hypothetical protein
MPLRQQKSLLKYFVIRRTTEMTNKEIGETIGFLIVVGLFGWALVSFFPLTWGQALIISFMFNKLLDVIR